MSELPPDWQPFWQPQDRAELASGPGIDLAIDLALLLVCAFLAWGGH